MSAPARGVGLGAVLAVVALNLAAGAALKAPCADGDWSDGRQYRRLCYTDVVPLYSAQHLEDGRHPYLDACPRTDDGRCDEYPVLTMYAMWLSSRGASTFTEFFVANALLLAAAAVAVAIGLYLAVGGRAMFFAVAPSLAIYGFINWDLIAVALATGATVAFLARRDVMSGVLLGLGAAAKLYPALLVIAFALERARTREPDRGIHLTWAAAGTWIALNLPFALLGFAGWSRFFHYNSERASDWDSLWFVACNLPTGDDPCPGTGAINVASLAMFATASFLLFRLRRSRFPDFPRWTLGFPVLVVFLLVNKVYSPQYGLWLLPWFALVMPDRRVFVAFEAADVAVFVTRFAWFGQMDPTIGGWVDALSGGFFKAAILARAAVLVACLVAWVRRPPEELPLRRGVPTEEPVAA